jgi:hypothetical protein
MTLATASGPKEYRVVIEAPGMFRTVDVEAASEREAALVVALRFSGRLVGWEIKDVTRTR